MQKLPEEMANITFGHLCTRQGVKVSPAGELKLVRSKRRAATVYWVRDTNGIIPSLLLASTSKFRF